MVQSRDGVTTLLKGPERGWRRDTSRESLCVRPKSVPRTEYPDLNGTSSPNSTVQTQNKRGLTRNGSGFGPYPPAYLPDYHLFTYLPTIYLST